jgi:hypothetical protein
MADDMMGCVEEDGAARRLFKGTGGARKTQYPHAAQGLPPSRGKVVEDVPGDQ